MATITLEGNKIETVGTLPKTGAKAPDFKLLDGGLAEKTLLTKEDCGCINILFR